MMSCEDPGNINTCISVKSKLFKTEPIDSEAILDQYDDACSKGYDFGADDKFFCKEEDRCLVVNFGAKLIAKGRCERKRCYVCESPGMANQKDKL